jgi:hypothetical protein
MANIVKIKRSAVASKIPTTTDLELGELAINTFDGKLFTRKDDGTASIIEIGSGGGGITYSLKTANYTAKDKDGILANTTAGSFTVTLPASPAIGASVVINDAADSFGTNNLIVARNGSTIETIADNLILDLSSVSVSFIYTGTTWQVYSLVVTSVPAGTYATGTGSASGINTGDETLDTIKTKIGILPVLNGGTGVTSSTGTVAVVLSNTPTLVTPILGAATATSIALPNSITLTNPTAETFLINAAGATATMRFRVAGDDRVTIAAAGNVLVGVSTTPGSPNARIVAGGTSDAGIQLASTSGGGALILAPNGAGTAFYTYTGAVGSESYTERMRIDSSGNITVANKILPNVQTVASAATITPNADTNTQVSVTALAVATTIATPSGTAVDGQKLIIRLEDNGVARAITWTTSSGAYRIVGTTLPTTTVAGKVTYVGCIYNSTDLFWDVIAVATQA